MPIVIVYGVICPRCGAREAVVFIRRSSAAGENRDIALCESCASSRGIIAGRDGLDISIEDLIGAGLDEDREFTSSAACPHCGKKLSDIRRQRRIGCLHCIDVFGADLFKGMNRPALDWTAVRDVEAFLQEDPSGLIAAPLETRGNFPLVFDSFVPFPSDGDDVVLYSSASIHRCLEESGSFSDGKSLSVSGRKALIAGLSVSGKQGDGKPLFRQFASPLQETLARRVLVERGIQPIAASFSAGDSFFVDPEALSYALLDDQDQLTIRCIFPGLAPRRVLVSALRKTQYLDSQLSFAWRDQFGWLSSRLEDCGLGAKLSLVLHLPALSATSLRDRLFLSLMAEGFVIRGYYSSEEESAGSVYEVSAEGSSKLGSQGYTGLCEALFHAAERIVLAERRARDEYSRHDFIRLADEEGRAFGIIRHCRRLEANEAASLLSSLRLASLCGRLSGVDTRIISARMLALGPASMALDAEAQNSAHSEAELRAIVVKRELALADYQAEEASPCSKV